jgi:RHS repeat-associated protein
VYEYDAMGNMTREKMDGRVANEFQYDAAGHLFFRRSEPFESNGYDYFYNNSDGTVVRRVKVGAAAEDVIYVGDLYERKVTGTGTATVTKYYYADGRRIAMRVGTSLYFLANDHLGGTSVVMNSSGGMVNRVRYYPFGNIRTQEGGTPVTDRLFTGQRRLGDGIYNYGARTYNATIGRFLQADAVVPGTGNPQSLNRYSYVLNNPMRYTDPTGNIPMSDGTYGGPVWKIYPPIGSVPDWVDVPFDVLNPPGEGGLGPLDALEVFPWFGIGDATSGLRFGNSCWEGSCDWEHAIGVAPIVPGNASKLLRALKFADEAGDAARIARALRGATLTYKDAAKLTKGERGLIQAHHILEQRHMRNWEFSELDIANAPAVIMPKAEHDLLTSKLRSKLRYGVVWERERVWPVYQEVYSKYPDWLKAIEPYFKR